MRRVGRALSPPVPRAPCRFRPVHWAIHGVSFEGRETTESVGGFYWAAFSPPPKNPIGGWYGLKKGLRGRFGVYLPPLMEELGLCELEHNAKNNRMRAI
jgi:hypothetical protein